MLLSPNKSIHYKQVGSKFVKESTKIWTIFQFMVPKLEERLNVWRWLETCKTQIDGYKELNQDGADLFEKMIMTKLKPNAKI